ncbi:MAG: hypothetical protein ACPLZC_04180 [Candidatus Bathyarchaeales archaeon]
MQSKTDDFLAELEAYEIEERHPRSFELYEEYSHKLIADTIKVRRENFEKANSATKKQLLNEVEIEIKRFRSWLEETKKLDPTIAYYIAVSLKSLLFGLPAAFVV